MHNIYLYILCMSLTTYLIRLLPLVLFKKEIKSKFIKSFLYYVPYACLSAMTFPAIIYATNNVISGIIALIVGVILALKDKSLFTVAFSVSLVVFVVEKIIELI